MKKDSSLSKKIGYFLTYLIGTAILKTWRIKSVNRESFDKYRKAGIKPVVALWHDSILPLSFNHCHDNISTIASDSKDGDLITYILEKWGYKVARGSSTRGGLKAALQAIKTSKIFNTPIAVTVDGPKGPRHEVKSGAVFIAKNLDKVIFVLTIKSNHFIRFNSWDKFILPKPFSKVEVHYSEPFFVTEIIRDEAIKLDTERLQQFMLLRTIQVDKKFV